VVYFHFFIQVVFWLGRGNTERDGASKFC